jgi:hypothetical protein
MSVFDFPTARMRNCPDHVAVQAMIQTTKLFCRHTDVYHLLLQISRYRNVSFWNVNGTEKITF